MSANANIGLILDVLPTELTATIFKLCLPRSRFIRPRPDEAPVLLGQICQQWRAISLGTSSLWCSLRIPDCARDKSEDLSHTKDLIELWLSRSGDCPLSIWCSYTPFDNAPIYRALIKTSSRWKDIRLEMLPQTPPLPIDTKFPLLESLEILTPTGLPSPNPFDSINPFALSPRLRKLVWVDPMKCEYEGVLCFKWEQLTHLTLAVEMPLLQCLLILSKSTALVQAAFQNINMRCSGDADPTLAPPTIHLPYLETLSILSASSFEALLERLTAPKLTELIFNLHHGRQQWEWPTEGFLSFLERSQCPIETLSLYFNWISSSDLISILMPIQTTLKALTIQGYRSTLTEELADRLTYNPKTSPLPLCPKLEFLGLFDCIDCPEEKLSALVHSRSRESTPGDITRLKVVECFEKDASSVTGGLADTNHSPILLRYDRGSVLAAGLNPKESLKLKRFKEEGLRLPKYSATTGQLGPIDDWYLG